MSTTPQPFSCGIAWPARTLAVCLLNPAGEMLVHRAMTASPATLLQALGPDRAARVVWGAGLVPWSGLAALCARARRPLGLGPALARQATPGATPNTLAGRPQTWPCSSASGCTPTLRSPPRSGGLGHQAGRCRPGRGGHPRTQQPEPPGVPGPQALTPRRVSRTKASGASALWAVCGGGTRREPAEIGCREGHDTIAEEGLWRSYLQ